VLKLGSSWSPCGQHKAGNICFPVYVMLMVVHISFDWPATKCNCFVIHSMFLGFYYCYTQVLIFAHFCLFWFWSLPNCAFCSNVLYTNLIFGGFCPRQNPGPLYSIWSTWDLDISCWEYRRRHSWGWWPQYTADQHSDSPAPSSHASMAHRRRRVSCPSDRDRIHKPPAAVAHNILPLSPS
jgi:hypothetical protein